MSDSATLWTVALQAPLSIEFSRQEYWGGLLFPTPGDLPDPGNEPASLMSPALVGGFFTTGAIWEASLLLLLSRFFCVRLCDPIDGSPPGSTVPAILQARTLEWVAISFSNA